MSVKVSIKWNKEKFNDVDVNLDDPPLVFKAQLFALSGVQPERQRIMFKGKTLGDESWTGFDIKPGVQLMMLGSADALPQAPTVKTVFLEDMTEGQLARVLAMPAGLKNLGNTCYMNATLQCLKTVPELNDSLKKFSGDITEGDAGFSAPQALTAATRDLFLSMEKSRQPEIIPIIMLNVLHMAFPHFGEKDEHGHFRQQDANEFWVELIRMFKTKLRTQNNTDVISQYFGGRYDVKFTCKEAADEPPTTTTEEFLSLSCFLSQEIKYLHSGLKAKLVEDLVKNSPTLNRDAIYEKKSLISRLPAYLTIQMVRFYYKERDKVNAKILKDVKFPLTLDVYDLCAPELQKKLQPMRETLKKQDDKRLDAEKQAKISGEPLIEVENKNAKKLPYSFPDDVGSNNSGFYELQAVLTHKGRSSNSGHYVGWIKRSKNDWLMCDDDMIRPVDDEEILKLSGGGDWHCAYVLLYGPKLAEAPPDEEKMETDKPQEPPAAASSS